MEKIAFALCCLVLPGSALAGTDGIVASNNQAAIQFISTYVNYTETGNGIFGTSTGTLDTETGSVPGAAISLSLMRGLGNVYLHAGYDYSSRYTNYTGSLQGGTFGSVMSKSSAVLINYSARFGKGFAAGSQFMLTPYVEFGRHEWDRGVNYGEIYTHYYYGIGLLAQYSPASMADFVLSLNLLLGTTSDPYITVNSGPGLNGFSGALGDSSLYRIGVAGDYPFTSRLHGNAGVEYTSFRYGMSAVFPVGGGFVAWEPDSKTYYMTIKLGLGLAF